MDVLDITEPDVGEVESEAISQLRQEVKHLEMKFENLLNATSDYLKKKKIPIPAIRISLHVRHPSELETDIDLVADHQCVIREADTVDNLFDNLSAKRCWDFMNPGLLKNIIHYHCAESVDIQHQKEEYLEQLQQFRKRTEARQFAKICCVSTLSPKFSQVLFKMGKDWDSASLEDVEQEIRGQRLFTFEVSELVQFSIGLSSLSFKALAILSLSLSFSLLSTFILDSP